MKATLLIILLFLMHNCVSQTYVFENASKKIKQREPELWVSRLYFKNKDFKWCDINPLNDTCINETSYSYQLLNDTIFIFSTGMESQKHPQFSLNKRDSTLFVSEDIDGIEGSSTEGYAKYVNDTIVKIDNKDYHCYKFNILEISRGEGELQIILLDKKTLIPIYSRSEFFDLESGTVYNAYRLRKLLKVQ